jgi:hypothetical protein
MRRPVRAEHLADDTQLEHHEPVEHYDSDILKHASIMPEDLAGC